MAFKLFFRLWRDGQLSALMGASSQRKSFYKLSYLAAVAEPASLLLSRYLNHDVI
jgi:hypothetical protein